MKKTLISLIALMIAMPVIADDCAYSPLQNLIRNIRSVNEINELLQRNIILDEPVRCGGTLMQLAILRGKPDVLQAMLVQDRARANAMVPLDYSGSGTRKVPVLLFAALHAPNAEMVQKLLESGADITKTDTGGRNVLWYMEQNPVLRNTALSDQLNKMMLNALVPKQTRPTFQFGGNAAQQGATSANQNQPVPAAPKGPSVVEADN